MTQSERWLFHFRNFSPRPMPCIIIQPFQTEIKSNDVWETVTPYIPHSRPVATAPAPTMPMRHPAMETDARRTEKPPRPRAPGILTFGKQCDGERQAPQIYDQKFNDENFHRLRHQDRGALHEGAKQN